MAYTRVAATAGVTSEDRARAILHSARVANELGAAIVKAPNEGRGGIGNNIVNIVSVLAAGILALLLVS